MRLLIVTQDFPPDVGGVQTYSWELARGLSRRADALHVIAPQRSGARSADQEVGFSVTRLPVRSDLLLLPALFSVPNQAHSLQPHVAVHAQWHTVPASVLARFLTGWPRHTVCAAHGREILFNPVRSVPGGRSVYGRLRAFALNQPDLFLPVSRYTAGLLHERGVSPARTHILSNGTDPEHFRPRDGTPLRRRLGLVGRPLLLTVGRLVPRKGIDTVIRALPAVSAEIPGVAYVVAGTGPDRSRLEALSAAEGVADRVHFQGGVPYEDLPLYYSAADLFVMPAREEPPDVEGFGIVLLEANACGTPVVGTRSGGIPDAVVEDETGLLVSPNDPRALSSAVEQLLTDPGRASAMGTLGRERVVQEATWDQVARRLVELLSEHVLASCPTEGGSANRRSVS